MLRLGVNLDHVATLRQVRGTTYPDLMRAIAISEEAGADGITMHLREDRRHIQDADVVHARRHIRSRLNLEMAASDEMIAVALKVGPDSCCIVPEKRAELTTEGGLDLSAHRQRLKLACQKLSAAGISVSLFIEPHKNSIDETLEIGAPAIELHTGAYAVANEAAQEEQLAHLRSAAAYAIAHGLIVNAGHGLHRDNVYPVARIAGLHELNIGHAIVADAVLMGLGKAVAAMRRAMQGEQL